MPKKKSLQSENFVGFFYLCAMLYGLSVRLYGLALRLASPFHTKARLWVQGRKNVWQSLEKALQGNEKPVVWVHVASLGEFEQARPVIEGLRLQHGNRFFLLLSFFSPSGYEVRKDYAQADFVTYLPIDTHANAKRWLDIIQPSLALWVKYEFWWNVLAEMQARKVPIVLFSATFRQEQFFFKPSARYFLDILQKFTQIFVQNEESLALLRQHNFENAQVAGDTRFDRVLATVAQFEPILPVAQWRQDSPTLVAGSVWERDLEVILPTLAQKFLDLKIIFAPHEIHESTLQKIESSFPNQTIRYSQLLQGQASQESSRVLLIDNVGMLSRLYHYGSLAYVGGAFKEGLHNILEPSAFGLPVIFGRDYRKFPEAEALIKAGGAFSIRNSAEFEALLTKFLAYEAERQTAGKEAKAYIENKQGGANKVLAYLNSLALLGKAV